MSELKCDYYVLHSECCVVVCCACCVCCVAACGVFSEKKHTVVAGRVEGDVVCFHLGDTDKLEELSQWLDQNDKETEPDIDVITDPKDALAKQ